MIINYFEAAATFDLPPEQAIAYFSGKGLKQSYNWHEMIGKQHDAAFTVAKMMDDDLLLAIRHELDKAIEAGGTLADFKKNMIPILQKKGWWGKKDVIDAATGHITKVQLGSASRLETIFRTNLQSSYAAGQWQAIEESKADMPYLMYDAVDDGATRAEHRHNDGLVLPVDDPFWDSHYPPNGWNCFLPETEISGDIQGGIKRRHNGKAIKILTASGRQLSVTPNHPILTRKGWIVAGNICVGDNLLAYSNIVEPILGIVTNNQELKTSAENLFQTLKSEAFAMVQTTTLNLNDDIAFRQSDINIKAGNSKLMDNPKPIGDQYLNEGGLERTDLTGNQTAALDAIRSSFCPIIAFDTITFQGGSDAPATNIKPKSNSPGGKPFFSIESQDGEFNVIVPRGSSSPRSTALPNDCSTILFDGLPLNNFGLGSGSDIDTSIAKFSGDRGSINSDLFSYLLNTYTRQVQLDPVIKVFNFDFSGHVYDFQSSESIVVAQGLIVHNCRCGVIQMDADEIAAQGLTISKPPKPKYDLWTNPTTGKAHTIPIGVDPGFVNNSGKSQFAKLAELEQEKLAKIAKTDPEAAAQAKKGKQATKAISKNTKPLLKAIGTPDIKGRTAVDNINGMELEYDPVKNQKNITERGLDFTKVSEIDWARAIITEDTRSDYNEQRFIVQGVIAGRLHVFVFIATGKGMRAISLRKANKREIKTYENQQTKN